MRKLLICLSLLTFSITNNYAQLAMANWRTHLAYNNVSKLAQTPRKIYAVGNGSLYSYDKTDESIEFYSKTSGLNGSKVTQLCYDAVNQQLIIIYDNSNIDLMSNSMVMNIPDLYNKQMSTSKNVNSIFIYNNNAYLSCDFGIVVLDLVKKEFSDTYIIGPNASEVKVLSTTINNGNIYALTSSTVYKAPSSSNTLVDYNTWQPLTGLPGTGNLQSMVSFNNTLYLLRNNTLYSQNSDGSWATPISDAISYIKISNGKLIAIANSQSYAIDASLAITVIGVGSKNDVEYDAEAENYWFAGADLISIINGQPAVTHKINGPAVNTPWNMTFAGKKLFVVAGGRWASGNSTPGTLMIYENGTWSNTYNTDINTGQIVLDFCSVAVDPNDAKHFFVTSYGTGLYEFKNDAFSKWYNCDNTNNGLESYFPDNSQKYLYIRLYGASYDKFGNLWVSTSTEYGSTATARVLLTNGTWVTLPYPQTKVPTIGPLLISSQNSNQKWILGAREIPGIIVIDDKGTISNTKDDSYKFMQTFLDADKPGSSFTPNYFYCIAQDKNGVIWVGTDQGPLLFSNLTNVFNSNYTCSRVKIPRNDGTGLADYLLATENIECIAIDGANRKWIGTESSGLYLVSEDGTQTIHHFTTSNSPILSNNIMSVAINPVSGEVFVGTDNGLMSYQSDAATAGQTFGDVHAYPNPVRQNYTGVITITGLVENAQVRITDLTGNLVCQTVSNGSLATWDGKDAHGRRVSTGIYIAMCASPDGTQNATCKILVIN
jgi:Two component regulator propeller